MSDIVRVTGTVNSSHLESQPLLVNTDQTTEKTAKSILLRQARYGFISGSSWGLLAGIGGGVFLIPMVGPAALLPAIPASIIGGGIGGTVSRVATSFFKSKSPSAWTRTIIGAVGGGITGATLLGTSCAAFLPHIPIEVQIIITCSASGFCSLMGSTLSCLSTDNVGELFLGGGVGSALGLGIGAALGYPVHLAGLGSFMGASMSVFSGGIGAFGFCCCPPCKSLNEKVEPCKQ